MAKQKTQSDRVVVHGGKELEQLFRSLPLELQKKALRKAARAAGKIVAASAKSLAPVKTGALRNAIKVRAMRRSRKPRVGIIVGPSARDFVGDQFYAAMIEYGTKKMAPKPFMRPAFQATEKAATALFRDELKKQIDATKAEKPKVGSA